MNPGDISRITEIVNLIRPAWSTGLIATVLRDERMIRRPHTDVLIAMTVLALDPSTDKPGRVHERGAWWRAVEAVSGPSGPMYRAHTPGVCIVCGDGRQVHADRSHDHHYENPLDVTPGAKPTPAQRAAIDAAAAETQHQTTAAREAVVKARQVGTVDEVLERHSSEAIEESA